ncbi:Hypothetical protein SMAX5B_003641 [Xyrichtys novacula]|uniref:Uncharacterized protein n=1 Tax=Xyrichtys novacula TaxID=13765 RepID=A0AAV1GA57_XYRNO|nr:Hypothetical protein SMAX5B_003641 [Xyrichtys novacula]
MFVLNLVFLTLLASSAAQPELTQYAQNQWIIHDDNLHYEDTDVESWAVEDVWPNSSTELHEEWTTKDQKKLLTNPQSYALEEQDFDEVEDSAVWKIVVVVGVLLVSVVGSVSMAYYYCVWRGGRIHYQPQKQIYA